MTSTSSSSAAEQPRRIAITNGSNSWGGTEQYAVQLAAGLQQLGCDVRLLWGHPIVGERARAAGVAQKQVRLRADADLAGLWRLARAFAEQRAEAVILTKWREYWLGALAARLAGVPLVVLRLGLRMRPRNDLKRRLIFKLADRVIVNAAEIRQELLGRSWIDPVRVKVVHNGVDLQGFRPGADGAAFRREIGVPPEGLLVGAIGALTPQKDHDLLARAAERVTAAMPQATFVVVGEGFLRERLTRQVAALGLGQKFLLPGFRADVRPVLAALDLFVLSSSNEGMARVLLEAMACGLPVVATDVSGTRACIAEGENGRIVPPADEAALAGAILALLRDEPARRRLGQQGRRIAEQSFPAERMIRQTHAILREAWAEKTGRNDAS